MTRKTASRSWAILDYPMAAPAPDGSVVEVAPGILWARMPLPIALDHINVYLLDDGDGWVIVDTGIDTPTARGLWEAIFRERLQGRPVKGVISTHWHYDHCGLAYWLTERFGVPLYMTHGEFFTMQVLAVSVVPMPAIHQKYFRRAGVSEVMLRSMVEALGPDSFLSDVPVSFQRLRLGDRKSIGGREWQILIGEGHSPEHACLYCAEERILIAGDHLLPRMITNIDVSCVEPEADPLQLWLDSLDRLAHLPSDTLVLPSHQEVFRGLHARIQELREHHEHQFDVLCSFIAEKGACTALEATSALFPRHYHISAYWVVLGGTIAHLSWLCYQGILRRVLDEDDVYRFELAG